MKKWLICIVFWTTPVVAGLPSHELEGDQSGVWVTTSNSGFSSSQSLATNSSNLNNPYTLNLSGDIDYDRFTTHFSSHLTNGELISQFGLSGEDSRIGIFTGSGKTTVTNHNLFGHLDQFHFHGGTSLDHDYSGIEATHRLSNTTAITVTKAQIAADALEKRSITGFSIQSKQTDFAFFQVKRGSETVGSALSASHYINSGTINASWMKNNNQARYLSLGYESRKRSKQTRTFHYSINFESTQNPNYDVKNRNQIILSLNYTFGHQSLRRSLEGESDSDESQPRKNRHVGKIGIAAVAAGALLSSGSSSSDSAIRIEDQHAAAKSVLNDINPVSVEQNLEYGGYVYRFSDGSYSTTQPVSGTPVSLTLPNPVFVIPAGTDATAVYHTHAAFDPNYDNENFSPTDLASDREFNLDGYLGTPGGQFKYHEVRTGLIYTLGVIDN